MAQVESSVRHPECALESSMVVDRAAVHTPILVLGMHRSGTSCLAGCLEEAGLDLGEVNRSAPFNAKGNRENLAVMELHDAVLERHDAGWATPPAHPVAWPDDLVRELETLVEARPSDRCWGMKDPRSLFLLAGWRRVTGPRYVGTFRHPLAVAASLMARAAAWRDPMPFDHAISLWCAYNARLLDEWSATPFPLIRYGVPPLRYRARLKTVCAQLALRTDAEFAFLESDLTRQQDPAATPPERTASIWKALIARAL